MFFDAVIQLQCTLQRLSVTSCTGILRHSIQRKTYSIELLTCIQRLPQIVDTPVDATIFLIDKVLYEILFGIGSHLQVFRLTEHPIRCREGPKNTGIENCTFLGILMQDLLSIDAAIESTMLTVNHLILPKAQDVVLNNILHFIS